MCCCAVCRQTARQVDEVRARSSKLEAGQGRVLVLALIGCQEDCLLHTSERGVENKAAESNQSIRLWRVRQERPRYLFLDLRFLLTSRTLRRIEEEEIRPGRERERGAHHLFLILLARRKGLPRHSASSKVRGARRCPLPIGCPPGDLVYEIKSDLAASRGHGRPGSLLPQSSTASCPVAQCTP